MALFRRQVVDSEVYDDQSPTLLSSFTGNWTHYPCDGFENNTLTSTPTPGASLSFTFSGSQALLYGSLVEGTVVCPTAEYKIDGFSAGFQQPVIDTNTRKVIYFQTPKLADGTHKIDIRVTTANETNQFVLDYFLITPSAGGCHSEIETSDSLPSSSPTSSGLPTPQLTPVGAIVGGVVGGIAGIVILAFALLWYLLRKRSRGGQAYYFEKPTPADILTGEGHIEPFDITLATPAPSSTDFRGPGSQTAYPDTPLSPSFGEVAISPYLSRHSRSGSSENALTYVSESPSQTRVGKPALVALKNRDIRESAQSRDSGIRFNENGEQEAGPSRSPNEIPPTYTPA